MTPDLETMEARESGSRRADVLDFLLKLWASRKGISVWIVLCVLAGAVYSLLATPAYYSAATISPRDSDDGKGAGLLSQLGGVGSVIAARMGGNTNNLEKVEIILKSDDLAEQVILKNDLMPVLFRDEWDWRAKKWKSSDPKDRPTLRRGMKKLRESVLGVTINPKKNVIIIGAQIDDSVMAKKVVEFYVAALNDRIRSDVMRSASIDRDYLESQLGMVSDPTLREKIQNMVSNQIEKTMLVRNQAFEVVEKPLVPLQRTSPKRKRIVVLAFAFGLFSSIAGLYAWGGLSRFLGDLRARSRERAAG